MKAAQVESADTQRLIWVCGLSPACCRLQLGRKGTWCPSARGVEEGRKPREQNHPVRYAGSDALPGVCDSPSPGSRYAPSSRLPGDLLGKAPS
jgi:hypothetical protein